jgi:hypothetical protein
MRSACCSPRCTGRSEQVDHILPVADGGDDSPENLRGVTTDALSTQRVSMLMAASCSSVTDAPATVLWVSAATGGLLIVIALCVKMRTHARDVSRGTAACSPNQSSASSQDHCLSDTNTCHASYPR